MITENEPLRYIFTALHTYEDIWKNRSAMRVLGVMRRFAPRKRFSKIVYFIPPNINKEGKLNDDG